MLSLLPGLNLISPGFYGDLVINGKSGITISAKDSFNPPIFNSINIHDSQNIQFNKVKVKWTAGPAAPSYSVVSSITGASEGIGFADCEWEGAEADGTGDRPLGTPIGRRMLIENTVRGVMFLRDYAHDWATILINFGDDVKIQRVRWVRTSEDIWQCQGTRGFLAEYSMFGFFRKPVGSEVHVDFGQWQHNGATRVSENITIRRNRFHSGPGAETVQCLFLKQEDFANPLSPIYNHRIKNVRITGNLIYAGHTHGISLNQINGAVIASNTLIRNLAVLADGFSEATYNPGIDQTDCVNTSFVNNIAAVSPGAGDLIISPEEYGRYYEAGVLSGNCPLDLIKAKVGGTIYTRKLGSLYARS